jgi:hypothetical protein
MITIDKELASSITKFLNSEGQYKVVTGLEGCSKSTVTIDSAINTTKDGHYIVYACGSFVQLKEKQDYLIAQYGGDKETFPIIGTKNSVEAYGEYLTSKVNFDRIYPSTKVILCTVAYLKKCCWIHRKDMTHLVSYMIVDEFDFSSTIVPKLDYLEHSHYLLLKEKGGSPSNSNFLDFIRDNYSGRDEEVIRKMLALGDTSATVAYWLRYPEMQSLPMQVVFLTSERLAVRILNSINFKTFEIESEKDMSRYEVKTVISKITTNTLYNINKNNQWNIFDYDYIISDKCTGNSECNVVYNHSISRGSNAMRGGDLLTIITAIPNTAIQAILDTVMQFEYNRKITFDEISKMYYMDRIRQAVGRTIGHRHQGNASATILINYYLYNIVAPYLCLPCKEFPYLCLPCDSDSNIDMDVLNGLISEKKTKEDADKSIAETEKKRLIMSLFKRTENRNDYLTPSQIKYMCKNIGNGVCITSETIAGYFGLENSKTRIKQEDGTYKTMRIIRFLKIR